MTSIEPLGQRFDPNQPAGHVRGPTTDVPEGTVVEVMQAGYTIGDRVLRPALVAVAKGGAKQARRPKQRQEATASAPGGAANDDFPARTKPPRGLADPLRRKRSKADPV